MPIRWDKFTVKAQEASSRERARLRAGNPELARSICSQR